VKTLRQTRTWSERVDQPHTHVEVEHADQGTMAGEEGQEPSQGRNSRAEAPTGGRRPTADDEQGHRAAGETREGEEDNHGPTRQHTPRHGSHTRKACPRRPRRDAAGNLRRGRTVERTEEHNTKQTRTARGGRNIQQCARGEGIRETDIEVTHRELGTTDTNEYGSTARRTRWVQ